MHHAFQQTSLIFWRKFTKGLLIALVALCMSHLILLFFLFRKEEHWILIPQFDVEKRTTLSSKSFGDEYLTSWASSLCVSLLCVNSSVVEERMKEALRISSPRFYGSLEEQLKQEVKILRQHALSTVFYPQKFTLHRNKNEIEVEGVFHTYFSKDKNPVVEQKIWTVGWEMGARGVILLTTFQEKKEEK